jgi:hypothetical protein
MKSIFVLLAVFALAFGQFAPRLGSFSSIQGVRSDYVSIYDFTQNQFVPQPWEYSTVFSPPLGNAINPVTGDVYFYYSNYVSYVSNNTVVVLGGENGIFQGGNIQAVAATSTTLYVCGHMTSFGPSNNQVNIPLSQYGPQIVSIDITNPSGLFKATYSASTVPPRSNGTACSSIFLAVNNYLFTKDFLPGSSYIYLSSSNIWHPVTSSTLSPDPNTLKFVTGPMTSTGQNLFVYGLYLQGTVTGNIPLIQMLDWTSNQFYGVYPQNGVNGSPTSKVIANFAPVSPTEIYVTYNSAASNDGPYENRPQFVYLFTGADPPTKLAPSIRFSSAPYVGGILSALSLFYDTNLQTVVAYGAGMNYAIVSDIGFLDNHTAYGTASAYGYSISGMQQYLSANNSWGPAYGGGLSVVPSAIQAFPGKTAFFQLTGNGFMVGYNFFADKIAVYYPALGRYGPFFPPGYGVDANVYSNLPATINAVSGSFSASAGGVIAGSFRTFRNTTVNSICWVNPDGSIIPLGSNTSDYSVGVRSIIADANAFNFGQATVTAIVHFDSPMVTYVAGSFNMAGPIGAQNFARYDWGSQTWTAVGGGVGGPVSSMMQYGNYLVLGGSFSRAGTLYVSGVVQFDLTSQTFVPMNDGLFYGGGLPTIVKLGFMNGFVVAGGLIDGASQTYAGGYGITNIALWDGFKWGPLSQVTTTTTSSAPCYQTSGCQNSIVFGPVMDFLSVGGYFYVVQTNAVYRFDGTMWIQLALPLPVSAIGVDVSGRPAFITNTNVAGQAIVYDPVLDNGVATSYSEDGTLAVQSSATKTTFSLLAVMTTVFLLMF